MDHTKKINSFVAAFMWWPFVFAIFWQKEICENASNILVKLNMFQSHQPTFYKPFLYNRVCEAFMSLQFGFVFFVERKSAQ